MIVAALRRRHVVPSRLLQQVNRPTTRIDQRFSRRLCTDDNRPPELDEVEVHNMPLPPTKLLAVLAGGIAGLAPPLSWGLAGTSATACISAPVLNIAGQVGWAVYHANKHAQDRRRQGDESKGVGIGVGISVPSVFLSVVFAMAVVVARKASESEQTSRILGELYADARSLRALERRVAEQQQAIEALQAEVEALRRESPGNDP